MEGEAIASGPNAAALFDFLFYAAGALALSFLVWGVIPGLIIGTVVLVSWNAWRLFRPVIMPVAAVLWLVLNYAMRLGILVGIGWALYRWLFA